jgi:hypothetical protein
MSYASKSITRRGFLAVTTGTVLGLAGVPKSLYADVLVTNENVLKNFTDLYKEVLKKKKGKKFEFQESLNIDDDNRPDRVIFKLEVGGSMRMGTETPGGNRLDVEFEPTKDYESKIYAIFNNDGEIIKYGEDYLCKTRFLKDENAIKYINSLLQHFKEDVK